MESMHNVTVMEDENIKVVVSAHPEHYDIADLCDGIGEIEYTYYLERPSCEYWLITIRDGGSQICWWKPDSLAEQDLFDHYRKQGYAKQPAREMVAESRRQVRQYLEELHDGTITMACIGVHVQVSGYEMGSAYIGMVELCSGSWDGQMLQAVNDYELVTEAIVEATRSTTAFAETSKVVVEKLAKFSEPVMAQY